MWVERDREGSTYFMLHELCGGGLHVRAFFSPLRARVHACALLG